MSRHIKSKHLGRHDKRLALEHRAKFDKFKQHKLAVAVLRHHYPSPPPLTDN